MHCSIISCDCICVLGLPWAKGSPWQYREEGQKWRSRFGWSLWATRTTWATGRNDQFPHEEKSLLCALFMNIWLNVVSHQGPRGFKGEAASAGEKGDEVSV